MSVLKLYRVPVVTADPIHLKRILTGVCARQCAFLPSRFRHAQM